MNVCKLNRSVKGGIGVFVLSLSFFNLAWAQPEYEIVVANLSHGPLKENWLFVPTKTDLKVEWRVRTRTSDKVITHDPSDLPLTYQVQLHQDQSDQAPQIKSIRRAATATFSDLRVGKKYVVQIYAFAPDGKLIAESEPAAILIGKESGAMSSIFGTQAVLYYLHPGRWQLFTVGKPEVFEHSTPPGQWAFIFLSLTAFVGVFALVLFASRSLYLGHVFPFQKSLTNKIWSLTLSYDRAYEKRITQQFRFVLKAWELVARKSREVADKAIKNLPNGVNSSEKLASVEVACMEYWTADGDGAIGTIKEILNFPHGVRTNGVKNPEDRLTELVIRIEDNFNEIIAANGNGNYRDSEKINMEKLISEIAEPVDHNAKRPSMLKKLFRRRRDPSGDTGLAVYPTSRIIQAGLEIHRMSGYRWLQSAQEVVRAFENRAANEIEHLKRRAKIDWFWNLAAISPLVGLFGTVTGITNAFQQLTRSRMTLDFVTMIQHLSHGIFEALWTTIFGLCNGIVFLLIYYYYKHKLDWIYDKWEEIYVTISEKL